MLHLLILKLNSHKIERKDLVIKAHMLPNLTTLKRATIIISINRTSLLVGNQVSNRIFLTLIVTVGGAGVREFIALSN
jgi:hypothetical protein